MRKAIRENIGMILAAHMVMLRRLSLYMRRETIISLNFTEPLKTERGELAPIGPDAAVLSDADFCKAATVEWGWESCDGVDQAAFNMGPDIDTMMLQKPVSEGYVKLDDFEGENAKEAIDSIEANLKEALVAQSKRIGKSIAFKGWRVYPTADRQRNLIFYARREMVRTWAAIFRTESVTFKASRRCWLDRSQIDIARLEQLKGLEPAGGGGLMNFLIFTAGGRA